MYYSPVPTLVVRADTSCLVSVNARLAGECSRDEFISIPICDTGDYYICVAPLSGDWRSMTRKLSFERGSLASAPEDDVTVCVWPGGVFEAMLFTGAYIEGEPAPAPVSPQLALAVSFARAVRDGDERGAKAMLTPALASSLDFRDIQDFFGDFADVRAPFSDTGGRVAGLVSYPVNGVSEARIFEFEFEDGRIANVREA